MATPDLRFESVPERPVTILSVPWQESHTVRAEELQGYIAMLERACEQRPDSADARTCLGLAHVMNCDLHRSLDALEEARRIEPENFFAQLKFAEIHYRLKELERADNETCRAAELAANSSELDLARRQLAEIRCLRWEDSQKPMRTRMMPGAMLALVTVVTLLGVLLLGWK